MDFFEEVKSKYWHEDDTKDGFCAEVKSKFWHEDDPRDGFCAEVNSKFWHEDDPRDGFCTELKWKFWHEDDPRDGFLENLSYNFWNEDGPKVSGVSISYTSVPISVLCIVDSNISFKLVQTLVGSCMLLFPSDILLSVLLQSALVTSFRDTKNDLIDVCTDVGFIFF